MEEISRQGVRQLPRHNPRELSGFGVEAVYDNSMVETFFKSIKAELIGAGRVSELVEI